MLPLIHNKHDRIVTVPWNIVKDFSITFSPLININLVEIITERNINKITDEQDISKFFLELRDSIDKDIADQNSCSLKLRYKKLSNINEIATYVLFGINYVEQETGGALYSDLISKTLILTWKKNSESPARFF